ncbi:MAG: ATP-binding protein [Myxococcales bacterium]|nr:ATP-binding protein [Myxococcales bacterium]
MFDRTLERPEKSFFLFGPRGTGKSTWLKARLGDAALVIDLLSSAHYLRLLANPHELAELAAPLKPKSWVVIDEVQRVPALLSEVHALYEDRGLQFALSGSSARKLRRGGADMLAGRAIQRFLHPLTSSERPETWSIKACLEWGCLPGVVAEPAHAADTLNAYVETYLRQEIMEEGLVRKLEPFARFLGTAGRYNGQVMNLQDLAREAMVARATVDNYLGILEDTLIAVRLASYRPGALVKEVAHPKLFFFDAGVARACAGLLFEPMDSLWKGAAFETFVLGELRAFNDYARRHRDIYFYRSEGGLEIDFVVELNKKTLERPARVLCIEVKAAKKWDSRWCKPARALAERRPKVDVTRTIGVYLGEQRLKLDRFEVWPIRQFLAALHAGEIF